jgi:hypothetical protein
MPDCFVAELVIGPATSGRTRWLLAMTAIILLPRFTGAERAYAQVAKLSPVPVPAGVR